jgi:hypothetical protein
MCWRTFLVIGFLCFNGLMGPLKAEEIGGSAPSIFLNPTSINASDLIETQPATYRIAINNVGKSLLYISKIEYT